MLPHTEPLPPISLSVTELMQLETLVAFHHGRQPTAALHYLERELERADIMPKEALPKDVVTMNALVTYLDHKTGRESTVTLVYPNDADINAGKISILSPLGAALIGMYVGKAITWYFPNGDASVLEVMSIVQPG